MSHNQPVANQELLDKLLVRVRSGQSLLQATSEEKCTKWFYQILNKADRARVVSVSLEMTQASLQRDKLKQLNAAR